MPLDWKREGVQFAIRNCGRVLIGDEMGLGKTVQAIATAWVFRHEWPLLIIVPSSVKGSWIDELEKWLPTLQPMDFNVVRSGTDVAHLDRRITLVTYGLLQQAVLAARIAEAGFKVIIVDESHYVKNRKAKRSKVIVPLLQQSRRCLLLSGTPALSRPEELYCQLDALCAGHFGSFTAYARRYCNAKMGRFGWDTKGASNLDELHARLRSGIMIRRLKKDVLSQLPPKRRQRVTVEVTNKKLCKLLEAGFNELKRLDSDPNTQQFESHRLLQSLFHDTSTAKMDSGMCDAGGKFLVFAYHLNMLKALEEAVASQGVEYIMIVGETPVHERHDMVKKFQASNRCRVAILSLLAASQGITLTAASTVVFAELHWTPGIIEQAEDRAHRIGQTDTSVNIHYLVAPNTLDDILWSTLSRKVGVVSTTLNGERSRLVANKSRADKSLAPITQKNDLRLFFSPTRAAATHDPPLSSSSTSPSTTSSTSTTATTPAANATPGAMWACTACTYRNAPSAKKRCSMCGSARPRQRTRNSSHSSDARESSAARLSPVSSPPSSPGANEAQRPSNGTSGVKRNKNGRGDGHDGGVDGDDVSTIGSGTNRSTAVDAANMRGGSVAPSPSNPPGMSRFQFCMSAHTGRVWLYNREGKPLHVNFHPQDFVHGNMDALPAMVKSPHAQPEIAYFLREYRSLRPIQQKTIANIVMPDVKTGLERARAMMSGSTTSGGSISTLVRSKSAGSGGSGGAVTPGGSTTRFTSPTAFGSAPEQARRKRSTKPATPTLHQFCTPCVFVCVCVGGGGETGSGGAVRRRLLELEGGVCQLCRVDAHALYKHVRALGGSHHITRHVAESCSVLHCVQHAQHSQVRPLIQCVWRTADHIIPVCEGGGECDLSNYRTLCTPCHDKETKKLAKNRSQRALREAAKTSKDIRGFFSPPPK
ncbi:hypothetical protein PTSG_11548 [Salpingoeca rosetta]|uniref:Zinc finger Ran-binding domain-containing protein 3 n=1 Tax=Salpingoeca rosetta (strain ATCC 50818 / BSB-021) TaxID=946362 RepID=F2TVL4_SALR5|nr:uncharacterized protein PTSG_11548 [Salpingoeca rosetta]EGD72110.1 hypothetical protein PTSG_11548 [Salpingoeca rosetta]|eukprot:XP_004998682.1 hypothetical protein PTSG_11548 [Salpingoeca rosetta]